MYSHWQEDIDLKHEIIFVATATFPFGDLPSCVCILDRSRVAWM
jgi:hypothetical protein